MREIGDRGVYGNPILPDFMVFLNWQELPWFCVALCGNTDPLGIVRGFIRGISV